jgi:hypothetical protein
MYGTPQDFGFLPPQFRGDVQIFNTTGVASTQWQNWYKPKGVSMVYMLAIGGGAGGGGGTTGGTTTARGGGGGGACSGLSTLMIPAVFLPDVLKVSVGQGGRGGAAGTPAISGSAGSSSFIATGVGLTAGTTIPNLILSSNGTTAPAGGGGGTATTAGPGGVAPTVATIAQQGPLGKLGFWPSTGTAANAGYIGIAGTAGGAQTGAIGVTVTAGWNLIPLTAGAGGAGVNAVNTGFAGGGITLQAAVDTADRTFTPAALHISGGFAGSAAAAGNGSSGVVSWKPFLMTGGGGGGSSDGSTGGDGGKGGIGCGGGGGGAGATGGRGGDGGPGLVVIISW